ncbi:MAG: UDP-2,3-diacylglucosamine diphosphatase [Pseudomonadota bacterium]|nr:UDP-2,3-diacylglucosamine diphosphatase [Pseudomonadota bacterium]
MTAAVPALHTLAAPAHWRAVDFISDLHLHADEPATFDAWAQYMRHTPADAVFILGDLFDVWVGDDAASLPGSLEARAAEVLRASAAGRQVHLMHGNRDFLVGEAFLRSCGAHALADPTVLHFAGQALLLTHGDALCTADVAYQRFRQQVRAPGWAEAMLARPLAERQAIGRHMRAQSQAAQNTQGTQGVPGDGLYAEIDTALARQWLMAADATTLVHGHTHAPGEHALGTDAQGRALRQVVLSDWHLDAHKDAQTQRAEVLRLGSTGGLQRLPLHTPRP